jgi:hypothetical protein
VSTTSPQSYVERMSEFFEIDQPDLYGVIEEYAKLTGVPVILNTSFNRQEPIVARPEEAISCFLRTDMDVLVLGDFYVTDRNAAAIGRTHDAFISYGSAADRWTRAQSRGQV